MLKNLLILLILLILSAFQAGCGSSGGGGGSSDSSTETESFGVAGISIPDSIQTGEETTVSAEIEGKDSEIILFEFQTSNGKADMVPSSGIIATHNKTGQVKLAYTAPSLPGTHYYYLKVLNSEGAKIEETIEIKVVN